MTISAIQSSSQHMPLTSTIQDNPTDDLLGNFMTLLVAQLKNQDPTDPLDNNQLTSQLTQFQTAAGVEKLNKTVSGMGGQVTKIQQLKMSDWVSRRVLVPGREVIPASELNKALLNFSLNRNTPEISVTLKDNAGNCYQGFLKNAKTGVNQYLLSDVVDFQPGYPLAQREGSFTIDYSATAEDGQIPAITGLKQATIESIDYSSGAPIFRLGLQGSVKLQDIYLIE